MRFESQAATLSAVTPLQNRRLRWGMVILLFAVIVVAGRTRLLQCMAAPLVLEELPQQANSMLLLGGDTRFDEAEGFVKATPSGTVLLESRSPGRLERLQIIPSAVEIARRELNKRGVPADRIEVIQRSVPDNTLGSAISEWFVDNPDGQLSIVCDAFSSRELRWKLNRDLPSSVVGKVVLRPLPSQDIHLSNWWQSKRGVMAFTRGWIGLILQMIPGREVRKSKECNPELFHPGAM